TPTTHRSTHPRHRYAFPTRRSSDLAPGGDDYHRIWINPENSDIILLGVDQGATITVNAGRTWSSWYNQPTAQMFHVSTDNRFPRSEEHTSELQSRGHLVCRLLLEKK